MLDARMRGEVTLRKYCGAICKHVNNNPSSAGPARVLRNCILQTGKQQKQKYSAWTCVQ